MGKFYYIPHGQNGADVLIRGILERCQYWLQHNQPLFKNCTLLLPNRRMVITMRQYFMELSPNNAIIMPKIRAIGDVDEDQLQSDFLQYHDDILDIAPAISHEERNMLISRFIQHYFNHHKNYHHDNNISPAHAYHIASSLSHILDQCHLDGVTLQNLDNIVHADYAEHWRIIVEFLDIIRQPWHDLLKELNYCDPILRRNQLLYLYGQTIQHLPPDHLLILAGSTGSQPATVSLMQQILRHNNGAVILHGLNMSDDDDIFKAYGQDILSSQYGFYHLLDKCDYHRHDVLLWHDKKYDTTDSNNRTNHREKLNHTMMIPSSLWGKHQEKLTSHLVKNIHIIESQNIIDEAHNIAIIMRYHLAQNQKVALVSDHHLLNKYVKNIMQQWQIFVDDSANIPISDYPISHFLITLIKTCCNPTKMAIISLLRHQYCGCHITIQQKNDIIQHYETKILRQPQYNNINHHDINDDEKKLIHDFEQLAAPIYGFYNHYVEDNKKYHISDILKAHITLAENISSTSHNTGREKLWYGRVGEALSQYLRQYLSLSAYHEPIFIKDYCDLFTMWLHHYKIAPYHDNVLQAKAKCHIWSVMEARMQYADCIILGNVNEGGWPKKITDSPWLSHDMIQKLGLQLPEKRIGLNAHDFSGFISAPHLYMTRATNHHGKPQLPSRWIKRLLALCDDNAQKSLYHMHYHLQEYRRKIFATNMVQPRKKPIIIPDISLRPQHYSVSHINLLMNNPYLAYCRYILKLKPLNAIDDNINAATIGNIIHQFCEDFFKSYKPPKKMPSYDDFLSLCDDFIKKLFLHDTDKIFFRPKFYRALQFFYQEQKLIHDNIKEVFIEQKISITQNYGDKNIEISAKADRIDIYHDDSIAIFDYKTGQSNQTKQGMIDGTQPQLPCEAFIITHGGFANNSATISSYDIQKIAYWQLSGNRRDDGKIISINNNDIPEIIDNAHHGLHTLFSSLLENNMPYYFISNYHIQNPLYQLARYDEWGLYDRS